jgi:hypothetical protein
VSTGDPAMTASSPAVTAPGALGGTAHPGPPERAWLARRLFPVLATAGLIALSMASTTWWGPVLAGKLAWFRPDDLWGTLVAAQRLAHLDLAGLYTRPTALISLPGAALILVPVVVLADAAGLPLQAHAVHPAVWLLAGPYEMALSAVVLFAADALAERLGASRPRRALVAGAGAVALSNVSVCWGHPEDAVAVGLLLLAFLGLSVGRAGRAGWLTGAAVAVQPLVLLALPVLVVAIEPRRRPGFLARAAAPGAALLAAAAVANWTATVNAVTRQPNWPSVDHPTLWLSLAPHLPGGAVAAGPARMLAILAACGCGYAASRHTRTAWSPAADGTPAAGGVLAGRDPGGCDADLLRYLLWLAAVALALRSVFEPVMVAYYLWPPLALALITAPRSRPRLAATALVATVITFVSQATWHSPWTWWVPMLAALALALALARPEIDWQRRRARLA